MFVQTPRFALRDFQATDRAAFVAYHVDPRYQLLYDLSDAGEGGAQDLFDLFLAWQQERPRRNFQVGIFDPGCARLLGCVGLRTANQSAGTAVLGIELAPENWGRYRLAMDVAGALIEYGFRNLDLRTIVGSTSSLQTGKGTVSVLPVDYLYWSPPLEGLVSGAGRGEMWISGRASERAKAGLAALGWTLVPKAGARLGE